MLVFAFTGIPTSGIPTSVFLWFKSVQSATLNHTIHEYECSISINYGTKVCLIIVSNWGFEAHIFQFQKVQHKMLLNSAGTMIAVLRSQVHSQNRFKPMKIIHKASRRISRKSEFFMYVTPAQPLGKTAKPNIGID